MDEFIQGFTFIIEMFLNIFANTYVWGEIAGIVIICLVLVFIVFIFMCLSSRNGGER